MDSAVTKLHQNEHQARIFIQCSIVSYLM